MQWHFQRLLLDICTFITMISSKTHVKVRLSNYFICSSFVVANQTSLMLNKVDKSWAFQVFHSKYCGCAIVSQWLDISNYLYILKELLALLCQNVWTQKTSNLSQSIAKIYKNGFFHVITLEHYNYQIFIKLSLMV